MSNATQPSQQSGDSRNRRSRGSKNRNNNPQDSRRSGERHQRNDRDHRDSRERGERSHRGGNRGAGQARAEEFRPQGPRPPRTYAPVKLSLWQKLLKLLGLYKAPSAPARVERKPNQTKSFTTEQRPPKSNTRNARTEDGSSSEKPAERTPRAGGNSKRGNRGAERSRGGDGSTVESPRVYVGNLSYDVSEQDLQELFKGIGGVRNVEIVYNRSTHRSKGYGFVEMLHMDEAIRSVEVLHDQPFMGRNLVVSGAKSKGYDEREEAEDRPEREPRKVVVAPLPTPVASAPVEETPIVAEIQPEPQIQTIVETVHQITPEQVPVTVENVSPEAAPKSDIA